MLKKIPVKLIEIEDKLNNYASLKGITLTKEEKSDHNIYKFHTESQQPGILRIYSTRKGITIDPSLGNNKLLNSDIINYISECIGNVKDNLEDRISIKNISQIVFDDIFRSIKEFIEYHKEIIISEIELTSLEIIKKFKVIDKCSKEEISIEYYKNGTLYLYGYTWSLGEGKRQNRPTF